MLGDGGTSKVYLAEHTKLQCYRAIKQIPKDHNFYHQLMNEASILKNLKHPNIPVIYDIEEDDEFSYIIEEYLEGQSLKAFRLCQSNIQEELVIQFAIQICDLFQYIHAMNSPILYLDLKPDNILIQNNILKLIDFGAAVFREESRNRNASFGTKGYAAPEQYKVGYLDERSDIYGIGMLLYFLVTKDSYSTYHKIKSCSRDLSKTIYKCLEYDPSQRYQDVTQLKQNLLVIQEKMLPVCKRKSKKSLIIAVAGAQSRIGTTHISLLITSYINQFCEKAIYIEKNDHGLIEDLQRHYPYNWLNQQIQCVKSCPILNGNEEESAYDMEGYPIRVCDYGVLSYENIEVYGQADIKLLVLGSKEWELTYSNQALKELIPWNEVFYLFNFVDGRQFLNAVHDMNRQRCLRVPYSPDPYFVPEQSIIKEFVEEFFQEKGNEKKTNSIKKHLWFKGTKD